MGITAGQRAAAQRVYLTAITGGAIASKPSAQPEIQRRETGELGYPHTVDQWFVRPVPLLSQWFPVSAQIGLRQPRFREDFLRSRNPG